jgi:hypothetical protein
MRAGRIGRVVFVVGLTMLSTRAGAGQSAYMAGGIGPTPVIEGRSADRNWFGMAGYSGRRGIGFRATGAETASRLGGGVVVDFNESDPVLTLGGGLRVQLHRLIFLFGEARLQTIPGTSVRSPETILPITFGLGLGT